MFLGLNGRAEFVAKFAFENGWAIVIGGTDCGHVNYCIAPAYCFEREYIDCPADEFKAKTKKEADRALAANDINRHFAGSDDEIFDLIASVKARPPYMADVAADMLAKVLKK